jgi:VIT1/CCC1 family predicted Fe2+/Mn2+ transporter
MNPFVKHVAVPAVAPAALVGLYFTPVSLVGCVNRGVLALAVVVASTMAACLTASIGARRSGRDPACAIWWLVSTLLLVAPVVLLLGPLG